MSECRSILIAEDDEDIRETISDVLKNEGYLVETVKNGKEAFLRLQTCSEPTLVLLDLMMPVMSGWEFLDAQTRAGKISSHKVVVISAVTASQSLQDPTPLNVAGSILKPMSLKTLLKKVYEFCGPAPVAA